MLQRAKLKQLFELGQTEPGRTFQISDLTTEFFGDAEMQKVKIL